MDFNVKDYLEKMNKEASAAADRFMEHLEKTKDSDRIDDRYVRHGLTPRELLAEIEEHGFCGSFDYPGGYEKFKEDVLSGKFDYVDEMKYGDKS